MATLYELTAHAKALYEQMSDLGLPLETIQDTIEAEIPIAEKIKSYVFVIKELEAHEAAAKAESDRIAERARKFKARSQMLKERLQEAMEAAAITKQEYPEFTVRLQKNPPSLSVVDESLIPKSFYVEQAPKLDSRGLINHIKDGNEIKGVEIIQKTGLRIV